MSTSNTIQRPRNRAAALRSISLSFLLVLGAGACNSTGDDDDSQAQDPTLPGSGGAPAGSGGATAGGSGGASATSSGGSGAVVDAGKQIPPVDAGHKDAAMPKPDAGHPDAAMTVDAAADDPTKFASGLNELFIDAPCDAATPKPPANMATCMHPGTTQHIEKMVTFGGDASVTYAVTLRIRGIWEPTWIDGGQQPDKDNPLTVGGAVKVASGDPINYQQYYIKVAKPMQTYWLNDYQYIAHDIHKEDYEATIQVTGGSTIQVVMNDGNDHQIANWTEDYFEGLAPYATAPSTGQMLRLDVMSVSAQ